MKDGRCPMCASDNVYENPELTYSTEGKELSLSDDMGREKIVFSFIPYVCMSCGYVAMYISDLNDIKDLPIIKGWKKVK
jgi:predicted Zn-ribbon and HTH transcriptional regulator